MCIKSKPDIHTIYIKYIKYIHTHTRTHTHIYTHTYTYAYTHTYTRTYIHIYIHAYMVSELGECISCFPDNHGRFGATGSDLGNGMRKFVKAKKGF